MWPWSRLSRLEARVAALQKTVEDMDVLEMERMRASVLNALRALRRTQQAQEDRENHTKEPEGGDEVARLLAVRRGSRGLL